METPQRSRVEDQCAVAIAAFRDRYALDLDSHRRLREATEDLCRTFFSAGLGDDDTHTRLQRKHADKCANEYFWPIFSEMLVAHKLRSVGLKPKHPCKKGPDFLIEHDGQKKTWIEVICPEATASITKSWLEPRLKCMPHEAILLRWKHAIYEKTKGPTRP